MAIIARNDTSAPNDANSRTKPRTRGPSLGGISTGYPQHVLSLFSRQVPFRSLAAAAVGRSEWARVESAMRPSAAAVPPGDRPEASGRRHTAGRPGEIDGTPIGWRRRISDGSHRLAPRREDLAPIIDRPLRGATIRARPDVRSVRKDGGRPPRTTPRTRSTAPESRRLTPLRRRPRRPRASPRPARHAAATACPRRDR